MNKKTDQIIKCDVVVVGAGVAGVCAAVAAARKNLKVVLVEKEKSIGGIAVQCMHQAVCGLYANSTQEKIDIEETLNEGLSRELVKFLKDKYHIVEAKKVGKVFVLPLPENSFENFLTGILTAEKNVTCLLNAEVFEVNKQDGRLAFLKVKNGEENIRIDPKIIIDCSGNSIVSKLADISFLEVDETKQQLCGYVAKINEIQNVDESLMIKIPYLANQLVTYAGVSEFIKYTTYIQGDFSEMGYLKLNIPYSEVSRRDEYLNNLFEFIVKNLPVMKDARIVKTSRDAYRRDGARLNGNYILQEEDVLNAKKVNDGVVKGAWPIEQWLLGKGSSYQYGKDNDYYEIPKRCLQSKSINNLLAAGKCISVSPRALASTRVIGIGISLGEASGKLAAEMIGK